MKILPATCGGQILPVVPRAPKFSRLKSVAGYLRARDYYAAEAAWLERVIEIGMFPSDMGRGDNTPLVDPYLNNYRESLRNVREAAAFWDRRAKSATEPPALDHDAMMVKRFGASCKVSPQGKRERRIAWNMLEHMRAAGWKVRTVYDGEVETPVKTSKAAMELMFNLDECWVNFNRKARDSYEAIFFVFGNDIDIVTDARYTLGSGFSEAFDSFNSEDYA